MLEFRTLSKESILIIFCFISFIVMVVAWVLMEYAEMRAILFPDDENMYED